MTRYIDSEEDGFHRYLLSWDDLGIEMVFDIDASQSKRVEAALKEERYEHRDPAEILEMALLRARFNSHRNYEVYAIQMPESLSETEVAEMFEKNFQIMTELVRKKGVKLY
jgi:hypothetical protein